MCKDTNMFSGDHVVKFNRQRSCSIYFWTKIFNKSEERTNCETEKLLCPIKKSIHLLITKSHKLIALENSRITNVAGKWNWLRDANIVRGQMLFNGSQSSPLDVNFSVHCCKSNTEATFQGLESHKSCFVELSRQAKQCWLTFQSWPGWQIWQQLCQAATLSEI